MKKARIKTLEARARTIVNRPCTKSDAELAYTMAIINLLERDETKPECRALNALNSEHIRRRATIFHHYKWLEEYARRIAA